MGIYLSKLVAQPRTRTQLDDLGYADLVHVLDAILEEAELWERESHHLYKLHLHLAATYIPIEESNDIVDERQRAHDQLNQAHRARRHLAGAKNEITKAFGPLPPNNPPQPAERRAIRRRVPRQRGGNRLTRHLLR